MGKVSSLFRPRKVTGGGEGLVSRAGLVVLGEVMEGTGLVDGFRDAFSGWSRRCLDPGEGFAQVVVGLCDGAKAMTDVTAMTSDSGLYCSAASNSTMADWFNRIGSSELAGITTARAKARQRAWSAGAGPKKQSRVTIDIDATLISAVDTKAETGPTRKGGYGYHPLVALCVETGEVFDATCRPGNAGANTAVDHVELLDRVIDQHLPEKWRKGHAVGDSQADTTIVVRCDTAGSSGWFIEHCIDRNLEFSFGYQIDSRVRDGLVLAQEEHWSPARDSNRRPRHGSQILEITNLVDLGLPPGVRVIARRERPHPGAQLSVFDDLNGWRHQIFITNSNGRPAGLERRHRQRGTAEAAIRDLKACGAANLPFTDIVANQAWLTAAMCAIDILAWTRAIGLKNTRLARATPKTLRYRLLHTAGRITTTGRNLHLDKTWPWTQQILTALKQITKTLNQPLTVTTTTTQTNPTGNPG